MSPFHLYLYGPSLGPIETSFEEAESRLIELPMLCFEPDGSFVWAQSGGHEQVYGMLYDAGGRLQYCDLQGRCSYQNWQSLCVAITGDPNHALEVMLLPHRELKDLQSFEETHWD